MKIQDKIIQAIKVILEAGQGLTQEQLADVLTGKASEEVQSLGFDQLETFGIAKDSDEGDWNAVFEHAIKEGLMKIKNQKAQTLTYTPEGKKFCKKNHSAAQNAEGADGYKGTGDPDLDALMRSAYNEKQNQANQQVKSERSKRQIKLIQAIDRKIALDELAESKDLDFDELLDEVEAIVYSGTKLNIDYFLEEVLDDDKVDDIYDYFKESETDDIDEAIEELGEDYAEEEVRLVRIKFISEMGN